MRGKGRDNTRILIVDDNKEFCESIADVLELAGHKTLCVYSGQKAIDQVKQKRWDVVLLDVVMPEMNGLEAYRKLRKTAPGLPVVMVSGFSNEKLTGTAVQEGVLAVIQKPVNFEDLFALLENLPKGPIAN